MHSFEVSLGYESIDQTTFSTVRFIKNVLRSMLSYPNETSKECIQYLNIPKWNKLAEKISQKNPEYMLNY